MSRTYRHINKDLEKNTYAKKMYMLWFEGKQYYDTKEEALESFNLQFHRDGFRHNADKSYRKILNNSKRNKSKNLILKHLHADTLEKLEVVKWYKDANLWYF